MSVCYFDVQSFRSNMDMTVSSTSKNRTVLRVFWKTLSWVTILRLTRINFSISPLDWIYIYIFNFYVNIKFLFSFFFILADSQLFDCFFKERVFGTLVFQNYIFIFHIINSWSYLNYLPSPYFMLYFSKISWDRYIIITFSNFLIL